jgi:hypothetical protein
MHSSHQINMNNKSKDNNTNNNMNVDTSRNPNTPNKQALPDEDISLTSTSTSTDCRSTRAMLGCISKTLLERSNIAGDGNGSMADSIMDPNPDEAWVLVPMPLDVSGVLVGVGAGFSE